MCLYVDKEKTEKFLEENKDKEFVYCHKVLRLWDNKLESPFFNYEWFPRKHESDCKTEYRDTDFKTIKIISKSFHLFITEEDAEYFKIINFSHPLVHKIVKFKCFMNSFVSVGMCDISNPNLISIAFRKVELSQEEYDKCFS